MNHTFKSLCGILFFFFKYFINNCGWYSFVDLMKNIREMYVVMSTLALIIWTKLPSYKIKLNKQTNKQPICCACEWDSKRNSIVFIDLEHGTWNLDRVPKIICFSPFGVEFSSKSLSPFSVCDLPSGKVQTEMICSSRKLN